MSIKKYTSGSWVTVPYRKYETATDTITTFPADVIADGQSASAVIKGNMSQSGTPTPSSPIYPTECGDLVASGEHSGQYEIPISSGGTTTNVYLGEVQSTRQIKKLVLTGEETWQNNSNNACCLIYFSSANYGIFTDTDPLIVSNAFAAPHNGQSELYNRTVDYGISFGGSGADRLCIRNKDYELVSDFKAWLAQQYAAGTPVCVWYVLATPTTGIVNEPIRKISTYADSVSVANIPTTGTAEQFDVQTDLKPSEVDLMYHGWHEHSDTKYT